MTVGLVADPCDPRKPGGLGRCIFEWTHAFIAANTGPIVVYAKRPAVESFIAPNVVRRPLPDRVWFQGAGTLDSSLDLYIFFTPAIPLLFRPRRAIVIAADFAYLDLPQRGVRERAVAFASYLMHRRSFRLAEKVICMSQATKRSAMRHFSLPEEKCVVVPLAAMPLPIREPISSLPERFFFFAGALKERKNVSNVLRAFARFYRAHPADDAYFLLAGTTCGRDYKNLLALIEEEGIASHVRFLGYVSGGQVAYLYDHALALVFASLVEGFGMPVLEAMTAGCPVITSNEGAVAEVAGTAALLVDPRSPDSIAEGMARIASTADLRTNLITQGKERAAQFSWDKTGRALLAASK